MVYFLKLGGFSSSQTVVITKRYHKFAGYITSIPIMCIYIYISTIELLWLSQFLSQLYSQLFSILYHYIYIYIYIYGYGSKLGTPKLWMVNTKLDIHICGPTSVFHFDPHPYIHIKIKNIYIYNYKKHKHIYIYIHIYNSIYIYIHIKIIKLYPHHETSH